VIGFNVPHIEDTVRAVEAAGGIVHTEVEQMPELGFAVAFVKDPEGHLIEIAQNL